MLLLLLDSMLDSKGCGRYRSRILASLILVPQDTHPAAVEPQTSALGGKKHHHTHFAMVSLVNDRTCSLAFLPFAAGPSEHSMESNTMMKVVYQIWFACFLGFGAIYMRCVAA